MAAPDQQPPPPGGGTAAQLPQLEVRPKRPDLLRSGALFGDGAAPGVDQDGFRSPAPRYAAGGPGPVPVHDAAGGLVHSQQSSTTLPPVALQAALGIQGTAGASPVFRPRASPSCPNAWLRPGWPRAPGEARRAGWRRVLHVAADFGMPAEQG